jgi:O-antigen/teichoic acid export membrane protein
MVAQKLIMSYGSKIAVQIIQIVASVVVARIAGPTVLGTVAFGLAFVSMFEFIADLGIGTAHIKLVSSGEDFGKCMSTFLVMKSFLAVVFFVLVLAVFIIQKYVMKVVYESNTHEYVIMIFLISVTLQQFIGIPKITFAARMEQAKYNIPDLFKTVSNQIMRIGAVLMGFRAIALSIVNLLSTLGAGVVTIFMFKGYHISNFDKTMVPKYFRIALPVMLMGMSTNILYYLDKVLLQYFTNSEQVGFYTAGYRIGGFVQLIASSAGLLFLPLFSKAVSRGDMNYIKTTLEKFERFSFLFIMPPVILLSIYSDVIVKFVLGSQYNPSIPIMATINFATFFMVLNIPYGNVLTGMGHFRLAAILNVINLLAFVALMYLLPNPSFLNMGAFGVAVAVLLSSALLGSLYRVFAHRKFPSLDFRMPLRFVLFGLVVYTLANASYHHLGVRFGTIFKVAFVPLYFLCVYSSMKLLNWATREDVDNLMRVFDLKKIIEYVRKEIKGEGANGKE